LLFGVLAFLLNFIPNIGSIIGTIPPILITLVDGSPLRALAVALVLGTIQVVIGNLIEPMVMGQRLQLNPITVLLFLALWGWLWGIWGMVLAVPLAATMRIILDQAPGLKSVGTLMGEA
jgi:predicted PurR-regulated permease PerM